MKADIAAGISGGVQAAKSSIQGMFSELQSGLKTAATLGGAIGFGTLVKGAVDAEESNVKLAASIELYSGKATNAQQVQEMLNRSTGKSKVAFTEARASLNQLAGAFKDPAQLEDALTRGSLQAKRLGVESSVVARVYTRLVAKGVAKSAEEAEALTEQMSEFGRVVLGLDPDEAIDPMDMAEFAAFTNQAGINMGKAQGILKLAGSDIQKDLGQSGEIIEEFGNVMKDVSSLEGFRKELKLLPEDINSSKDAVTNMLTVISQGGPKGVKKLLAEFGNERTKAALRNIIGEELVVRIEKGEKGKEIQAELEAKSAMIRTAVSEAEKNTVDMGKIAERNAKITETSGAKFQDALNKIQAAFQQPEMISAISALADALPKLVKGFSALMEFATKFPKLAALLTIGGRVGLAGAGGFVSGLFKGGASATGAGGVGGGAGVINVSSAVINVGGLGGTQAIGDAIGQKTGESAKKFFNPGDTGKILGIAAAALIAHEIGKEAIDAAFDKVEENQKKVVDTSIAAANANTTEQRRQVIESAQLQLDKLKEFRSGGTIFGGEKLGAGEAAAENVRFRFGQLASLVGATDIKPEEDLNRRQAALEDTIKRMTEQEANAKKKAADAALKLAGAMDKAATSTTNRGPADAGPVVPGAAPKGG